MQTRIPVILGILMLVTCCTDYVELRDCTSTQINISDNLVISQETVKDRIWQEYGCCIGRNLDSLDLGAIEGLVDSIACVKKSQVWITRDGVLHVDVLTRKPAVRLCHDQQELFSDSQGYLFPIGEYPLDDVCRVMGEIPLSMRAGTHGQPNSERKLRWLLGVMDVVAHRFDGQISVTSGGELRLLPNGYDEVYLFGAPVDIQEKFDKIEKYEGRIRPIREYTTVNLKYKGQIICRNGI